MVLYENIPSTEGTGSTEMLSYPVKLIAVSGREQPVVLKIRRDGLWLYTEHGKEIQQLPYQHIVKWLPSKMRSRDPGPDGCLDIQVETASGKKDLRMRCQSEALVQSIIADIRNTVQAIMTDIEPARRAPSPPRQRPAPEQAAVKQQQPAAATPRPASPLKGSAVPQQQQFQRPVMPSKIPGPPREIGPPTVTETGQRSPQLSTSLNRQHQQHQYQQQLPPLQPALQQQQVPQHDEPGTLEGYEQDLHLQQHMRQQNPNDGYSQPRQPSGRMQPLLGPVSNGRVWDAPEHAASQLSPAAVQAAALALAGLSNTNEMALDPATGISSGGASPGHVDRSRLGVGPGALLRRSTGELSEFTGEAAAQIQFLEDMVRRLSEELAGRVSAESLTTATAAAAMGSHGAEPALPPWMKDSRYLNPLLSAYDQRLSAALAELSAKTDAVRDIQDKVQALVAENESLHGRIAKQAVQLETKAADTAATAAAMDSDKARLQERLDLLEQENDLLVSQQGALDDELTRLNVLMQQKDQELSEARSCYVASSTLRGELEQAVKEREQAVKDHQQLRSKTKSLSERLAAEGAKTAEAIAAAEGLRYQQQILQQELAAAQAVAKTVPGLQAELSSSRSAADASSSKADRLRSECDGLRAALHAVEQRLVEYQEKDTEVYLRIKEAMELAEEARLERDAARTETDSWQVQLAATQAKLQEATRQLSGAGADGPSYKQLKRQLAAAQDQLAAVTTREQELSAQVSELRMTSDRLSRDKQSLLSEVQAVRDELEINSFIRKGADLSDRLADSERARDDALQKLDSIKRATARVEREWELERQQMQGDIQRLTKQAAAAEKASSTAQTAATEAQQAVAAIEGELNALRAARARVEGELRQQLQVLRSERDAEVAALVQKLERALATCDKSVMDAEQMLTAKDSLLRRWKQEAQLIASKLEVALQQHQAELTERQAQVAALTQQLAAAHEQQELMQQELDATRMSCHETELLLGQAENRAAAADANAADQQDDIMQELRTLQVQLECTQLDKLRAERSRDDATAKLSRLMMAGVGVITGNPSAAGSLKGSTAASTPVKHTGGPGVCSPRGAPGSSKVSASASASPSKGLGNSSTASSSRSHPRATNNSTCSSPRDKHMSIKVAGNGLSVRGPRSPAGQSRVGEAQQKDQQYSVHTES